MKRLQCIEKNLLKWMCSATMRDGQISEKLRSKLGIENISEALKTGTFCLFGPVETKEKNDLAKHYKHIEVEGRVPEGRPRKIWDEVLRKNLENQGMNS